jgi:hypothetical protein
MRTSDGSASSRPRGDAPARAPSASEGSELPPAAPLGAVLLLPAAVALGASGVVLAVAITWGAAEAAVAVGAGYLVYSAINGRSDLGGTLAVRLLTGVLRRQPSVPEGEPPVE